MTKSCRTVATVFIAVGLLASIAPLLPVGALYAQEAEFRTYDNRLTRLNDPDPILADHPEYIAPIEEQARFAAAPLIEDEGGKLIVRSWRFSYNARGIVEMTNRLNASTTAVIMVHPWGIDDGQGWRTPEPAGAADFCTVEKNHVAGRHTREVIDPFLNQLRPHVGFTMFSLPGGKDDIRGQLYRSFSYSPTEEERKAASVQLKECLEAFSYRGNRLPESFEVSSRLPTRDYFRHFPGLDAGAHYNNEGFWELPIPVSSDVTLSDDDVVIYDAEGYDPLRAFLSEQGIRHVLLTGYATDMCFCRTTAGYENLARDFNVFLVGDATLATFPANLSPSHATNAAISLASLNHMITQVSWVSIEDAGTELSVNR